jgi:hypothetical protein
MNQKHKNTIKKWVYNKGLSDTLELLGGNTDAIRKVYQDNPESYMDFLIGNLEPTQDFNSHTYWFNYKIEIFVYFKDSTDEIFINDYIWNHFYKSIMRFDDDKIGRIMTKWLYDHYSVLSTRKPKPINDYDIIMRRFRYNTTENNIF